MIEYDVAIIGAGPAGLASAQRLSETGFRTVVFDIGRSIRARERDGEAELAQGHGGAGLYSDGKFSFFPSASALWSLPGKEELHAAYRWTCAILRYHGLDTPPFPSQPDAYSAGAVDGLLKVYPSDYLSFEARLRLITALVESADASFLPETTISEAEFDQATDSLILTAVDSSGEGFQVRARKLIIASGRFGPLNMGEGGKEAFRRLEVGFRIEQPAHKAFFGGMEQLDPKLKFTAEDEKLEWRTFCACRNGETVFTNTLGLWTVSGHSDGPDTGRSNIGFNTRITDPSLARGALPGLINALQKPDSYYEINLISLLNGEGEAVERFDAVYGTELAGFMLDGLWKLIDKFPQIYDGETKLIGPTLEGVGWYPGLDENLKLGHSPVWVAGDACGLFRGIVAAFISGHYTATMVLRELEKKHQWTLTDAKPLESA